MRVVVLGGFGNFGSRIVRALREEPGAELVATARHPHVPPAGVTAAALDMQAADFASHLRQLQPGLVIHCVGPFQGQDYRAAHAALAAGAHYIDLADGRQFAQGFVAATHAAALAAGRAAICGSSTLPALSSAVIDRCLDELVSIEDIDIAIAPAQRAVRGVATIRAVFSYLGKPIPWLRDGQWGTVVGWQELKNIHFDFGTRLAAACDVPDLVLLPERYPGVRSVAFRAALELRIQHYFLWCLAGLRRIGVPLPLRRGAAMLDRMASWLNCYGSECGGMRVQVRGVDAQGRHCRATWQLTAPDNHGPEIPCMAAILLARQILRGSAPPAGASTCMGLLSLEEFAPQFARWGIRERFELQRG